MNAFLWTVAALAAFNTLCVLFALFTRGGLPEAKEHVRMIDAMITACFGVWALCLLFR